MKKFLLFLTLFLSAVGIATAAEVTDVLSTNVINLPTSYDGFTYTASDKNNTSNAEYSGNAIKQNNNIQINNSTSTGFYVSKSPGKLLKLEITKASGSKTVQIYASTSVFSGLNTTNATLIKTLSATNGTTTIDFTTDENLIDQGYIAFYIKGPGRATQFSSIKVTWEIAGSGGDEKDCGIAFTKASGAVTYGETFTLPFQNDKKVAVTFSSDNEDVAAVDANTGAVTIKGIGTANIKASFAGNTTYDPKEVTFTLTVTKRFTWSDTKAVLVTDASTLKPGDVIIIANQAARAAMSTSTEKDDKRPQTSITLSTDKSEITSISSEVLLLELGQVEVTENETTSTYWTMKALNYTKDGLLYCGSTKNEIKIGTPKSSNIARAYATISIASNKATILFNKGTSSSSSNRNNLRYNNDTNSGLLFACYENGQQPVYIYRLEGSTTITDEHPTCKTPVENGNTTLTANSTFSTNSTASDFVVKMNGVEINATVEKADDLVSVDMVGLPYVPGAVFTISPVVDGKELHPVTLGITIPTLPVVDLGAVTLKLYFDKDAYGSTSTSTCNLDAWAYLPVVLKDAARDEVLAADDARRNLALTFKEFANSVAGSEIWGWYDENKDQVQWCKYNYLTNVPVDKTDPENPTADLSSIDLSTTKVELTFTPVYSFNVANKFASLIPSATPGSLSAPARAPEGFTVQNVELTALPVSQTWGNTPDVSGVESVVVEGVDGAVEYYNMQGVRVEGELAPGMYIRRQGRSVSKVQIR